MVGERDRLHLVRTGDPQRRARKDGQKLIAAPRWPQKRLSVPVELRLPLPSMNGSTTSVNSAPKRTSNIGEIIARSCNMERFVGARSGARTGLLHGVCVGQPLLLLTLKICGGPDL